MGKIELNYKYEVLVRPLGDYKVRIEPDECLVARVLNYNAGSVMDGIARTLLRFKKGRISQVEIKRYLTDPASMDKFEKRMVEIYLKERDQRN